MNPEPILPYRLTSPCSLPPDPDETDWDYDRQAGMWAADIGADRTLIPFFHSQKPDSNCLIEFPNSCAYQRFDLENATAPIGEARARVATLWIIVRLAHAFSGDLPLPPGSLCSKTLVDSLTGADSMTGRATAGHLDIKEFDRVVSKQLRPLMRAYEGWNPKSRGAPYAAPELSVNIRHMEFVCSKYGAGIEGVRPKHRRYAAFHSWSHRHPQRTGGSPFWLAGHPRSKNVAGSAAEGASTYVSC